MKRKARGGLVQGNKDLRTRLKMIKAHLTKCIWVKPVIVKFSTRVHIPEKKLCPFIRDLCDTKIPLKQLKARARP